MYVSCCLYSHSGQGRRDGWREVEEEEAEEEEEVEKKKLSLSEGRLWL
jgi:hypothetical protein